MTTTASRSFKATATRSWSSAVVSVGLCAASLATAAAVVLAQGPLPLALVGVLFFVIFLMPAVSTLRKALAFPELRVDGGGMTMSAQSHEWRILWEHVTRVAVVPMHGLSNHGWLVVWPKEGIARPAPRPHFPEWRAELSAIRFCDLDLLGDSRSEAIETVKKAAGPLWTDTPPRTEQ